MSAILAVLVALTDVLFPAHNLKVFGAIVVLIVVFMVNMLIFAQFFTQAFFFLVPSCVGTGG